MNQQNNKRVPKIPEGMKIMKPFKPINDNINSMYLQYESALYQGQCIRNAETNRQEYLRHGEGILFFSSGEMIMGIWKYDFIEGECIIFMPWGGMIFCQMMGSKIVGWVVALGIDKSIICQQYHLGVKKQKEISYFSKTKKWTIKTKSKFQVIEIQQGKVPMNLNEKLFMKLTKIFKQQIIPFNWRMIKRFNIADKSFYIGYLDEHYGNPNGLGALITQKQMYSGIFYEGFLNEYGRIIYANGDIYQGKLQMGQPIGKGNYYSLEHNQTTQYYVYQGKTQPGKVNQGKLVINKIIGNYGDIILNRKVQKIQFIDNICQKINLIYSTIKRNENLTTQQQHQGLPSNQGQQVDLQLPQHQHAKVNRKLSMATPLLTKNLQVPVSNQQKNNPTVIKVQQPQPGSPKKTLKQKDQTLTFMKRVTQDIEKKMNDIPSFDEQIEEPVSPTKRKRIFGNTK